MKKKLIHFEKSSATACSPMPVSPASGHADRIDEVLVRSAHQTFEYDSIDP